MPIVLFWVGCCVQSTLYCLLRGRWAQLPTSMGATFWDPGREGVSLHACRPTTLALPCVLLTLSELSVLGNRVEAFLGLPRETFRTMDEAFCWF